MSKIIYPVYKPSIDSEEKKNVIHCLDSKWISSRGDYISSFEDGFSKFLDIKNATSVSNGTVALHLALYALGIRAGDEVILPSLTYVATANAVKYVGATPVFADSDEETWNIDPKDIEKKISPRTKAILVVHLYGNPCALTKIQELCSKYNLFLIEDTAEAFGSIFDGKYVGGFGDLSTFSFFGNKTITTGEGGMIASNNPSLIDKIAYLKNQAVSPNKEYWHDDVGFNYRMTNICAAIGLAQLKKAKRILQKKSKINSWYISNLKDLNVDFQKSYANAKNSYWMVTILAQTEDQRNDLRKYLLSKGIETRPMFYPLHSMKPFFSSDRLPVVEKLSVRGINLPSYPDLLESDVKMICESIRDFYECSI